jgi:hypothetical protein
MEFAGRPLAGFVEIQPDGYRTERALEKWVRRGLDFVSTLQGNEDRARTKGRGTEKSEQLFGKIALRLLQDPDVTEGTGFGTGSGLRVGTRIFAMLGRDGELIVKLPQGRVDQLVTSGMGARLDPRRDGRQMRAWLTVPFQSGRGWGRLVDEALRFVRSAPGKPAGKARGPRRS